MTKRTSVVRVLYLIAFALLYLCWLGYVHHVQVVQQRPFGRCTEQDAIKLATPVIQAILPNRNDLYVTTEHGSVIAANSNIQHMWSVDCMDSHGNHLIHVTRDAVSGTLCWVGYEWTNNTALPQPIHLTPQTAASEAKSWMRTLGFTEEWHQAGVPVFRPYTPQLPDPAWVVTLLRPGRRARVIINERAGTLVFASIVPTR